MCCLDKSLEIFFIKCLLIPYKRNDFETLLVLQSFLPVYTHTPNISMYYNKWFSQLSDLLNVDFHV